MSIHTRDILTSSTALPRLDAAPARRTDLRSELEGLDGGGRAAALDAGRVLVAQLKPGEGYFTSGGGALHVGPWNAPWIRLDDGRVARPIGQVQLPRP